MSLISNLILRPTESSSLLLGTLPSLNFLLKEWNPEPFNLILPLKGFFKIMNFILNIIIFYHLSKAKVCIAYF